jgi:hypothetical protein
MWLEFFLCLFLAHLLADFVLQTSSSCRDKSEKHWRSLHQYVHAMIVFALSWLVSWDLSFWWGALMIGFAHLLIDVWKSYKAEDIKWFLLDQFFHCLVLIAVAFLWFISHTWEMPSFCSPILLAVFISILICWKPANIFIKLTLKHYSVNMPEEKEGERFNAGALIGNVERWLILVFVYLGRYEALGLLIAAKSIIRFSESQTNKTEYVLAGTLMSILIAVLCGLFIVNINQILSFLS